MSGRQYPRVRKVPGARLTLALVVFSGFGAGVAVSQTMADQIHPRLRRTWFTTMQPMPALAELTGSPELPDAPLPQSHEASPTPKANPCPLPRSNSTEFWARADTRAALPGSEGAGVHPAAVPCRRGPLNAYERFMNGPKDTALTPQDKAWLAARNVADPFNLITIAGEAAISVGLDSHSPYGPGMRGYARYVGVSTTEDITGEFFGTFLIPAVMHQDPHYHRMEGRPIRRRVAHAVAQIFWTESDTGRGMPNYANLVGFGIEDEIGNLYVPGRQTDAHATATRYGIALASAPIGNLVNEFLPDVASHIHVQIVILQRIINQVARSATAGNSTGQSGIEGESDDRVGW
jgi:hypothetical protein